MKAEALWAVVPGAGSLARVVHPCIRSPMDARDGVDNGAGSATRITERVRTRSSRRPQPRMDDANHAAVLGSGNAGITAKLSITMGGALFTGFLQGVEREIVVVGEK